MERFLTNYRIYYEDTDALGLVYYANYLKFFERARTDFLRHKGLVQSELINNQKLIFVVRNCLIEYKQPAKLDDLINVSVVITEIGAAFLKIKQEISRENLLLAVAEVEIVALDCLSMKPKKIPEVIRLKLTKN